MTTIRVTRRPPVPETMLDLTGDFVRVRVDLLVVPPDATDAAAEAAFTAATARDNRSTPTAVLAAGSSRPTNGRQPR